MTEGTEVKLPEGSLVSGTRFIYKAQVEPVRARPVCGGIFSLLSLNPVNFGYIHCSHSTGDGPFKLCGGPFDVELLVN